MASPDDKYLHLQVLLSGGAVSVFSNSEPIFGAGLIIGWLDELDNRRFVPV